MTSADDWLTRDEPLALRLRRLRTRAYPAGKDFAAAVGWPPSKVSKLETGKQPPTAEDIAAYVRAAGADEAAERALLDLLSEQETVHRAFKVSMRGGQAAVQRRYNRIVEQARRIIHFETFFVPGLLQTPDYAREVLIEQRAKHSAPDDVADAVAERMQRQQLLYRPDKTFEFLLWEPVLYGQMWSPSVMRAQLGRLLATIGMDRVRFGVLPLSVRVRTAPESSVQVYDGQAVIENQAGEVWFKDDAAKDQLRYVERLWEHAAEGDAARVFIEAAVNRLATQEG